ncbi:hypothetical protein CDAR_240041, partial [Caerostris darwini]
LSIGTDDGTLDIRTLSMGLMMEHQTMKHHGTLETSDREHQTDGTLDIRPLSIRLMRTWTQTVKHQTDDEH